MSAGSFALAVAVLGLGTYALRFGGMAAGTRAPMTDEMEQVVDRAVAVLLVAVAVTSTFYDGAAPADLARPVGVAAGVVAAVARASLVVVVLVAALTTALVRAW
ncbi:MULTISPECIES: AzlD domain-containing protein [Mumia]|uniref:AzlD domain-containing protein n=1 Tax=Mumia TaxID=1546255 RepID=UPI00141F77A2|nr:MULTISPECIES: AzlD domain-containing protein [unclassified Mumia]QMW64711.1 AzlD domain-containing protein [Mumia sp. ZJ1417]